LLSDEVSTGFVIKYTSAFMRVTTVSEEFFNSSFIFSESIFPMISSPSFDVWSFCGMRGMIAGMAIQSFE
jgi:hypothetical protein